LCDENNEYGALEMGAAPEFLPGFLNAGDAKDRDIISKIWYKKAPSKKGMTISEIFHGVLKGKIKALYIIGENPAGFSVGRIMKSGNLSVVCNAVCTYKVGVGVLGIKL